MKNNIPDNLFSYVRATAQDASQLAVFESIVADPKLYGIPATQQTAEKTISENEFYFIKLNDKIVGTFSYQICPDQTAYIGNLAIHPDYRGKGLASSAMAYVISCLDAATRIELVTHPDNAPALKIYQTLGFRIKASKENYFGDGEPRLLLALTRPTTPSQSPTHPCSRQPEPSVHP